MHVDLTALASCGYPVMPAGHWTTRRARQLEDDVRWRS